MSRLLTTVTSRGHALNMYTHKNLGDSTPAGVLPLILPQRKHPPWIAHWKGTDINKAELKFTGSWGSWGSEVPKFAPTPHLPDELDPLLDSLTPLITCSKVGTFGKRPMDE